MEKQKNWLEKEESNILDKQSNVDLKGEVIKKKIEERHGKKLRDWRTSMLERTDTTGKVKNMTLK